MIEEPKVRSYTETKVRPKMVWDIAGLKMVWDIAGPKMVWDIAGPNTNRFQSKNFLSNIDDFQMEMEKEIKVRGGIFSYKSRNL